MNASDNLTRADVGGPNVRGGSRRSVGKQNREVPKATTTPTVRRKAGMQMLDAGETIADVAAKLGVDSRTVRRWRHRSSADRVVRSGLPVAGRPRLTPAQRARLFAVVGGKRPWNVGLHGYNWTTATV